MTTFTLWFDHYNPTEREGVAVKHSVGITQETIHVVTPEEEYWLPLQEVLDFVYQNGHTKSEEPAE